MINRSISILLTAVLLWGFAWDSSGQNTTSAQDTIRRWSEGALRWADYCGDGAGDDRDVFSYFSLGEEKISVVKNGRKWLYSNYHAVLRKDMSFVNAEFDTEDRLAREQRAFDCYEIAARRFRDSVLFAGEDKTIMRNQMLFECLLDISEDTVSHREVLDTPMIDPTDYPWKEKGGGNFALALNGKMVASTDGPQLTWFYTVSAGWARGHHELCFEINAPVYAPFGLEKHIYTYPWTYYSQTLYYGYTFYRHQKISFEAFAGGGIGAYAYIAQAGGRGYESLVLCQGLLFEYKLMDYMLLNMRRPERLGFNLYARLYSDQMYFKDRIVTPTICFSIGLRLSTRRLFASDSR